MFAVTTELDVVNPTDSVVSLREALQAANAAPGADTVTFDATVFALPRTIQLSAGPIDVADSVAVAGPGTNLLTVRGNGIDRLFAFNAAGGNLTLGGMTLTGGRGAVIFHGGILTITDAVIRDNTGADFGGGVYAVGAPTGVYVLRSTFANNSAATGGGLYAADAEDVLVEGTAFTGNTAEAGAGAYFNNRTGLNHGQLVVRDSTFADNRATLGEGGGLLANGLVSVQVAGSTFSGNATGPQNGYGGGLGVFKNTNAPAIAVAVRNCTIFGNTASAPSGGGGMYVDNVGGTTTFTVESTVVSGNSAPGAPDLAAGPTLLTRSAVGSASGFTLAAGSTGNLAFGTNLRLGPLQANGGRTATRLPLVGSPLLNAGSNPLGLAADQRGDPYLRVVGSAADIGAVEVQAPADLSVTLTDGRLVAIAGEAVVYTAVVRNTAITRLPGAMFTFAMPAGVQTMTWTSVAVGGATSTPSGSGPIADTLDLPAGASVTYTVTATVSATARGTIQASATIAPPLGFDDPNSANNTATDKDTILVGHRIIAVGAGEGGGPEVLVMGAADGQTLYRFNAYDAAFRGGVRVATADLNRDGMPDIITAPGVGGGPHVKVFDGASGALLRQFFAYDLSFRGGVWLATGQTNGELTPDIITGAGEGGGPHVKVFDGASGALDRSFLAYDISFRGGVTVAGGDVTGDGFDDVVTGTGPGGGPHVKAFDLMRGTTPLSFFAYETTFTGGVFVAVGNVDDTPRAEILTAPGMGGGPVVKAFRTDTLGLVRTFFAYTSTFRGGVRLATIPSGSDAAGTIVTGAGVGGAPHVRAFDAAGAEVLSRIAFDPTFLGGVYVG
ncbi:MAG: choice-of-anchor Q domain-containing protein [Gemmataceae bacterium]